MSRKFEKHRLLRPFWMFAQILFFVWTGLASFVLEKSLIVLDGDAEASAPEQISDSDSESKLPIFYSDAKNSIRIQKTRWCGTTVLEAEVKLSDVTQLKRFFAKDTYGINIREETSTNSVRNNAIFAISGDYYSVRKGLVVMNGVEFRDYSDGPLNHALVIDYNGDFDCDDEPPDSDVSMWQGFQFGPTLIDDGKIDETMFTGRINGPHPRTALGQIGPLHYLFVVSSGREKDEKGLTLMELAEYFKSRNCIEAYNLDGGGTSTMVWRGRPLNTLSEGYERPVADIIGVIL